MLKKVTIFSIFTVIIVSISAIAWSYFFVDKTQAQNNYNAGEIVWGVDFSQSQSEFLGLNWKENYLAIIKDLGAKNIKLHTQWDLVETENGSYNFDDIDWQIKQAEENNVKIIFVVGIKTGRWPECHEPKWAHNLSTEEQKERLLKFVEETVLRYRYTKAITSWQVENEPLFGFGECPNWYYKSNELLKSEVKLVKSLDFLKPVIISDSGEQSNWSDVAKVGDIVGITMYRNAWTNITDTFGFNSYSFLKPSVYAKKVATIKEKYNKDVICIELQAEPWASKSLVEAPLEEQAKSMNLDMFKENIEFAKQTGLKQFYFWGAEWWYWMKSTQNQPEIWNEAQNLFSQVY